MSFERPYAHLRAADADRERVAKFLREQHAVGRLTHDELEERVDRAYHAVTMGDLDRLIADLPHPNRRPEPRRAEVRRRPPRGLIPVGLAALLAFSAPTAAMILFVVMAAVAVSVVAVVFALGVALGPFLVVALLLMLALRRRRPPPRHVHWRYH
jgi:Flp pilus assembly protein TadB